MFRFESTYKVKVNDDLGSSTYWNSRFQDLDLRINATESYTATINAAADNVTSAGIARVNNTLNPFILSVTDQVAALQVTVSSLQALVISDQDNVIGQLDAILAQAQTLLANLQSLGTIQDGTF